MNNRQKIIMIGPNLDCLGGISRVAQTYKDVGIFNEHNVKYIGTTTDKPIYKYYCLLKGILVFFMAAFTGGSLIYIHATSYNSFYRKSFFIIISIILSKKIVLHIHSDDFKSFLHNLKGIKKIYVHYIIKKIHTVIVLSESMKKIITSIFNGKNVHLLCNPVNIKSMINKNFIERDSNKLLYLGWYVKAKGVYDLVDAIQIISQQGKNVCLDFYGTKEVAKLTKYVNEKGLTKFIKVNGWLGNDDKIDALYRSTMLILPSHTEGIPNVILEAMATHTPIISTSVGGLIDILKDGENCIIANVSDPKDLSKKILLCLEDKLLRDRIANNAFLEARAKYDVNIIKENFSRIIENIMS